jgi:acetaldehyde dehydrogenase (acetylating)
MYTRVVQWIRMPDYESGGRKFDSCRAYQHQQGVAQLVERKVWLIYQAREAVGSIPTTLTIINRCETKKEDWQSG